MTGGRVSFALFRWAAACAVFVLALAIAFTPSEATAENPDKWYGWWELGGAYGSDDTSRSEVTLFAPIGQTASSIFFADIRGKLFEDDVQEVNLALGHRRMLTSGWNFGFWGGLDVRNTENDNRFWQVSGGLEALSDRWDVRVNGYAPVSDPKSSPSTARVFLSGNNILMAGGAEVPLYGVDGEIGFKVFGGFRGGLPQGRRTELRVYGGGFWFDADEAVEEVAGPKARIEFRIEDIVPSMPGSRLTLESEYSHDDVRGDKWEVGARLRFPFGRSSEERATAYASLSPQARRMTETLERDTDIVTVESKEENVEDALTNVSFNRVAFVAGGGSVTTTSNQAGGNSLVLVNGTIAGTQTLLNDQTLQGGGSTIQVRGRKSGTVAGFTAPGGAGRLTAPGLVNDNLILTGSNTHISGLTIVGAGAGSAGDGIDVDSNKSNVFLTNLMISDTGDDGVDIDDNNVVTIVNLRTMNTFESGISLENNNTVSIMGGSITNPGEDGVQTFDGNRLTISDLTITNAGFDGVFLGDGNIVDIHRLTVNGTGFGQDGVELGSGNRVTIMHSTFTNTDFGVFTPGIFNNVTITDTTFSDIGGTGILDVGSNNLFKITGSTFGNVGVDAIDIDGTLFISNTTFAGTVGANLFLFDFPGAQVLAGSTGNVNETTNNPTLCETTGGSFTGTIGFVDGTVLQDNVAPCN